MKCKMIVETRTWNPDWNPDLPWTEENPRIITRPVGHIQEHPDCWRHCARGAIDLNNPPIAVPADEECREACRKWLKEEPARIKQIAHFLKTKTPKSKLEKERLDQIRKAYSVELNDIDPDAFPITGGTDDADIFEEEEDD